MITKKSNKKFFRNSKNIICMTRLVARSYFKNYSAIFTDFLLPIILVSIIFNILPNKNLVAFMIPGALLTPIITSCLISLGSGYTEWKQSVIIKKIRLSKISTTQFFVAFIFFFFIISLCAFAFNLSYVLFLEQVGLKNLQGMKDHLSEVNLLWAAIGLIMLTLLATSGGFLIGTISKRVSTVTAIALTLFLIQSFMLGNYLPLNMVIAQEPMKISSYFLPFFAPVRIFQVAWLEKIQLETGEYFIDENWKVMKDIAYIPGKEIARTSVSFHDSYWSLVLLGSGLILIFASASIYITKNQKFS